MSIRTSPHRSLHMSIHVSTHMSTHMPTPCLRTCPTQCQHVCTHTHVDKHVHTSCPYVTSIRSAHLEGFDERRGGGCTGLVGEDEDPAAAKALELSETSLDEGHVEADMHGVHARRQRRFKIGHAAEYDTITISVLMIRSPGKRATQGLPSCVSEHPGTATEALAEAGLAVGDMAGTQYQVQQSVAFTSVAFTAFNRRVFLASRGIRHHHLALARAITFSPLLNIYL